MRVLDLAGALPEKPSDAVLVYATADARLAEVSQRVRSAWPGAQVFGATSYRGVFTPDGFKRGAWGLGFEPSDGLSISACLVETDQHGARREVASGARAVSAGLGGEPDAVLIHATPGFEERALEGLSDAGWGSLPTYGGSAADDDLTGKWRVFHQSKSVDSGVLLVGFRTSKPPLGAFVSGYFGTRRVGEVTRSEGRTVFAIDGRPAADVLDEWMGGSLQELRKTGGVALEATTLSPIGRVIDRTHRVPRYLLSHPHLIHADTGAISFFTEFAQGEQVELMMATKSSLVERTQQVVSRAVGGQKPVMAGGVLVYCGGCVGAVEDQTDHVAQLFHSAIGRKPFIGAATFGEVGTFLIDGKRVIRHGNLMCDTLLFQKP